METLKLLEALVVSQMPRFKHCIYFSIFSFYFSISVFCIFVPTSLFFDFLFIYFSIYLLFYFCIFPSEFPSLARHKKIDFESREIITADLSITKEDDTTSRIKKENNEEDPLKESVDFEGKVGKLFKRGGKKKGSK